MAKVVKVFLSSTFRDMHAEREALIKNVFPRIQEEAAKYDITLYPIDLRWGVTEEQIKKGEVVQRCLDAIEEAKPYFIGIIGKRYGWIPTPSSIRFDKLEGMLSSKKLEERERSLLKKAYCYKDKYSYKLDQGLAPYLKTKVQKILEKAGYEPATKSLTHQEIEYALSEESLPIFIRNLDKAIAEKDLSKEKRELVYKYYRYIQEEVWECVAGVKDEDRKELRNILEEIQPALTSFHTFFFFRQDVGENHPDYIEKDEKIQNRLESLKDQIIKNKSVFAIEDYPCDWDQEKEQPIQNLKTFENMVFQHLSGHICSQNKGTMISAISDEEREDILHGRFIESSSQNFVGREELIEKLCKYTDLVLAGQESKSYGVIIGEPGSGKSAFLAKFAKTYSQKDDTTIIARFIGLTPKSSNPVSLLRNICIKLSPKEELPYEILKLRSKFTNIVKKHENKILLILDGLNQLEEEDNIRELQWLPNILPDNICVITSLVEDKREKKRGFDIESDTRVLEHMQRKNASFMSIDKLSVSEKKRIIRYYLRQYNKELPEDLLVVLASKKEAYNPLYLVVALEELRMWGYHEGLRKTIQNQLPETIVELFAFVLERIEKELNERFRPQIEKNLFRFFMEFMTIGLYGVREEDIIYLLGNWEHGEQIVPEMQLPHLYWSEIKRSMRRYLTLRGGYWNFFHRQFKQAVIRKYFVSKNRFKEVRENFVKYLNKQESKNITVMKELPYHLALLSDNKTYLQQLEALLSDIEFMNRKVQLGYVYELYQDYVRIDISSTLVNTFFHFFQHEMSNFQKYGDIPGFVYQQALNQSKKGLLVKIAKEKLENMYGTIFVNRYRGYNKKKALLSAHKIFHSEIVTLSMAREKKIAAATFFKPMVKIFDFERSIELFELTHKDACKIFEVSPDGKIGASAADEMIYIWDLETGELLKKWQMSKAQGKENLAHNVESLCLTNELLFIGGPFGHIRVIELKNYKLKSRLFEASGRVEAIKISDNGILVASYIFCERAKKLIVWDVNTEKCLHSIALKKEESQIVAAVSENGERAITIATLLNNPNCDAYLWDLKTGECIYTFQRERNAYAASLSPDGKRGVFIDSPMELWDLEKLVCLKKWDDKHYECRSGVLDTDGKMLYTGSCIEKNGSLFVWDLEGDISFQEEEVFEKQSKEKANFSKRYDFGKYYFCFCDNKKKMEQETEKKYLFKNNIVKIWDREKDTLIHTLDMGARVSEIAFNEKYFVAVGKDLKKEVVVWNIRTGKLLHRLHGHTEDVNTVSIASKNPTAATAGKEGGIILWNLSTGKRLARIQPIIDSRGNQDCISQICMTPDGNYLAYRSLQHLTTGVYDITNDTFLNIFVTPVLRKIAISPCGNYVVTTSGNGRDEMGKELYPVLRVWRVSKGKKFRQACEALIVRKPLFEGNIHKETIDSISITPDGYALTISRDGIVVLWELETGRKVAVYPFMHPVKECIVNAPTFEYNEEVDMIDITHKDNPKAQIKGQEVTIPVVGFLGKMFGKKKK